MPRTVPIERLRVEAFRGIQQIELNDLRGINLLFGPNNSGKSTILEAIALFSRPLDLRQWLEVIQSRDPGRIDENRLISLRWCFPQFNTRLQRDSDDQGEVLLEGKAVLLGHGPFPARELHAEYHELFGELTEAQFERRRRRLGLEEEESENQFQRGAELTV